MRCHARCVTMFDALLCSKLLYVRCVTLFDALLCSMRCYVRCVAMFDALLCSLRCYARCVAMLDALLCSMRCYARCVAMLDTLLCSMRCYARRVATVNAVLFLACYLGCFVAKYFPSSFFPHLGIGHTTSCFLQVEGSDDPEPCLYIEETGETLPVESVAQLAHALCREKLKESSLVSVRWPKEKCPLLKVRKGEMIAQKRG